MKRLAGVVAEYNPFHNGHRLHLQALREGGADYTVAVMSGHFVQRGEPALLPKHLRGAAAVACGCDLVLELPMVYAMSTAQRFAASAVGMLLDFGVNMLSFGCENANLPLLVDTALLLNSGVWTAHAKKLLAEGVAFAAARGRAVGMVGGRDMESLLSAPNNLLAVEYIMALAKRDFRNVHEEKVTLLPIPRMGAAHDAGSSSTYGKLHIASGTFLRQLAWQGGTQHLKPFVPPAAMDLYDTSSLFEQGSLDKIVLARLRQLSPADFRRLPDCTEGLEHRLYRSVESAATLEQLFTLVKTKRYTLSRIRRLCWSGVLGVKDSIQTIPPPYLRILAMGEKGGTVLGLASPALPLSHSLKQLEDMGGDCGVIAAAEAAATDLYGLGFTPPLPRGFDYRLRIQRTADK